MVGLFLASLFFLGIHLFISGTRLRDSAIAAMGEASYLGTFSAASIVGIVAMAFTFNATVDSAENIVFWHLPSLLGTWVYHLGALIMLFAVMLAVIGITAPGITGVQIGKQPETVPDPRGIYRVTRHPFLQASFIWSLYHIAMNGDLASLIFFSTFSLLALFGTLSIDRKRARKLGPAWAGFAAVSSNIPFAAILQGRNKLVLSEIHWWQWLAGLAVYLAIFFAHMWMFNVSPTPNWTLY